MLLLRLRLLLLLLLLRLRLLLLLLLLLLRLLLVRLLGFGYLLFFLVFGQWRSRLKSAAGAALRCHLFVVWGFLLLLRSVAVVSVVPS